MKNTLLPDGLSSEANRDGGETVEEKNEGAEGGGGAGRCMRVIQWIIGPVVCILSMGIPIIHQFSLPRRQTQARTEAVQGSSIPSKG